MKLSRRHILFSLGSVAVFTALAQLPVLDWNKITHWTGEGENKTAIVIQFNDGIAQEAYVWGYRWEDVNEPTSHDAMTAIACETSELDLFLQHTSKAENGITLAGIGMSRNHEIIPLLTYDFQSALKSGTVTFNWYATDADGNLIGPGDDTPDFCAEAISNAKDTHIIWHPIDALSYARACRDYDFWQLATPVRTDLHWNAGWTDGNWVMWAGSDDFSTMKYSGMGYASRKLNNNEVVVWNFNRHPSYPTERDQVDGYTGASIPCRPLDYDHSEMTTVALILGDTISNPVFYDLQGYRLTQLQLHKPDIYIVMQNGKTSKIILK